MTDHSTLYLEDNMMEEKDDGAIKLHNVKAIKGPLAACFDDSHKDSTIFMLHGMDMIIFKDQILVIC